MKSGRNVKITWSEEEHKEETCEYFIKFLDIGIEIERMSQDIRGMLKEKEKTLNFYEKFFSETYAKPIKDAVKFHFLQEQKTNRIEKPEWLFAFIQNCLEINLNALLELGVNRKQPF